LDKMIDHSCKLNENEYPLDQNIWPCPVRHHYYSREAAGKADITFNREQNASAEVEKAVNNCHSSDTELKERSPTREKFLVPKDYGKSISHTSQMREVGIKVKGRVMAIKDENDEKIRDCSMRVDGMAMATQWVRSVSLNWN